AGEWPPRGARPVDVDEAYERLAAAGQEYGPAFRALQSGWRRGDELFAELALPSGVTDPGHLVHPVLLDAAAHLHHLLREDADRAHTTVAWSGLTAHRASDGPLRAGLAPAGPGRLALHLADADGEPVLDAVLTTRPLDAADLAAARSTGTLLRLGWAPVAAGASGHTADEGGHAHGWAVLGTDPYATTAPDGSPAAVHRDLDALDAAAGDGPARPALVLHPAAVLPATAVAAPVDGTDREPAARTLALLRRWAADERWSASRLVVVTEGAVATPDRPADPAQAAVLGLVRAARAEHPGRFAVVDLDGGEESRAALGAALRSGHAELTVRQGIPYAPAADTVAARPSAERPFATGTVLLTGADLPAGAALARHLVRTHGARHLLLAGTGHPAGGTAENATGLGELAAELRALGAERAAPPPGGPRRGAERATGCPGFGRVGGGGHPREP
ncbi:polyketide synthase dehydratase domain-containing protein, partial [Kitasatospora sp. NPDC036755]|uniref:polyketide synthase dehydratase domain-containing protein n=1 Tax=Kitasatospora sp. NPDC036755 TaxID=3154600 RepID=UPI0033FE6450